MGVKWEEPKKPVWHERLLPLKERPGDWGIVREYAETEEDQARARKYAWRLNHQREEFNLPAGSWRFVARPREGGGFGLFARYEGDDA